MFCLSGFEEWGKGWDIVRTEKAPGEVSKPPAGARVEIEAVAAVG